MENIIPESIVNFFTTDNLYKTGFILIFIITGLLLLRIVSNLIGKILKKKITPQSSMIIKKLIFYLGSVIILIIVFQYLDIELTPLLGAAGIAGIAIGFASQTSISNLISGIFLISEKSFQVGDVIKLGDTTGIILSIDLLSVKIRTHDNRFIRIPNEKIITSELVNITRFPIRRMDIDLNVAYKENINRVRELLLNLVNKNPYALDEPEPLLLLKDFGESGMVFLLGIWFEKTDFLKLKNSIMQEIKENFDAEGIEIPLPHRVIYTGADTAPFPVILTDKKKTKK